MIRFVMMSSNEKSIKEYGSIIDKLLMSVNLHYETYAFNDNNKRFDDFCNNMCGSSVFIIENDDNIEALDVIKKIRNVYKIYVAFIIIIDKNKKLNFYEVANEYSFLCEVIQENNVIEKLNLDLEYILNIIYNREKALTFVYEKVLYKIPYRDILYIEKELNGKRCMIVCKNKTYTTYKSLVQMRKDLDDRFVNSHQSALININNIREVDFINNKIIFDKKIECNLFSRNMKKKFKVMFTK